MKSHQLWGLAAASLALSLPAPALAAVQITPTGTLFTDYSLPAAGGGVSRFEFTRARIGLNAKINDQLWGNLTYDVAGAGGSAGLRYGYLAFNPGWGTWTLGQQATLFSVPVEQSYFPRYIAKSFTEAEGIVPTYETGLSVALGGNSWSGVGLNLGYFDGTGLAPETSGSKAYEGLLSWGTGAFGVDLFGRDSAVDNTKQGVLSLSYDGGAWTGALEGALTAAPGATSAATGSTGVGGSLSVSLPDVGGIGITPILRGDYYTSDTSVVSTAQDTHLRGIVAFAHDYAPGVSMSLDDTYTHYLNAAAAPSGAQDSNVVAVHGQLKF